MYLLSKLHSLEQLDLSGNMLQEFPKGLRLPCLKILDCSKNEMEDVLSLEGLSNMEELRLEDNIYLTVRTLKFKPHSAIYQYCLAIQVFMIFRLMFVNVSLGQ